MSYIDFLRWLKDLDASMITSNPIIFKLSNFNNDKDFVRSMFMVGKRFKGEDDIVVRYSKPFTEDNNVEYQFEIYKSKTKMLVNYLKNNDTAIACYLSSNKEIKEGIKFFNSLGVKGEGMIGLVSKENDYASTIKESLEACQNCNGVKVNVSIEYDEISDAYFPILTYNLVESNGYSNLDATKSWIKSEILKIKD